MAGSFNAGRNAGSSASQDRSSQSQDRQSFDRPSNSAGRGAGQESTGDRVRARAYEIFESRTVRGEEGDAMTDWLRAEVELSAAQTDESDSPLTNDQPSSTDQAMFRDQVRSGRDGNTHGGGSTGYSGGVDGPASEASERLSSQDSMPDPSGTSRNTERGSRY